VTLPNQLRRLVDQVALVRFARLLMRIGDKFTRNLLSRSPKPSNSPEILGPDRIAIRD
jgi:hypothetical protein